MRAAVESLEVHRGWLADERGRLLQHQADLSNQMRRSIDRVAEVTNEIADIDAALAELAELAGGES